MGFVIFTHCEKFMIIYQYENKKGEITLPLILHYLAPQSTELNLYFTRSKSIGSPLTK